MLNRTYDHSEDTHVRRYHVYIKANSTYAFSDEACTTKIDADTLMNAFIKGMLIVDTATDDTYLIPVGAKLASKKTTITYLKPNATTATSADFGTITSE